jgi:hypothetical protein
MQERLFQGQNALAGLCRRHGIRRLSLFGSTLKGTARPASDVDLLVEFVPGLEPCLLGPAEIEAQLSALLDGRRVDLRTPADLSRHFRDEAVSNAAAHAETRLKALAVPWNKITAMRNRLVHAYFDIDPDILWKTAGDEIPALCPLLKDMVED